MYIMEVIQNRKQLGKITYSDFFSYKNILLLKNDIYKISVLGKRIVL